ncbi:MAG TPA: Spy/CpxP family protein refolding chaperone [Thermoanaerobaculia bacterium]|nr:Spy/CpxP family protein refolding chaperone [Thermoanaerobaculia bacterium]
MKKSVVVASLLLFAHSLAVFAEELPPPVTAVVAVLELNNDQVQSLLTMVQARDAALRPLAEELQRHQQMLEQLLQSPDADAATVGRVVLETRAFTAKIGEVRAQANAQFEQVLTPEQSAKLQHIREAAAIQNVVNAFRAVGLAP